MRTTSRRLLEHGCIVGAYNVFNMEQVLGLFRGAERAGAPVIVQFSRVALRYAGLPMLEAMIEAAERACPEVVYSVHLDHGDEETCREAITAGIFSSVMIDASHHDFETNVAITRRVTEHARARGVWVEAELGTLAGVEDDLAVDERDAKLTDPAAAREFVVCTGCDALAVAVGNSHGAYKHASTGGLQLNRIEAIHRAIPDTVLVLHGSSTVPAEEVRRINGVGGALGDDTSGVRLEQVLQARELGVRKINIATDARLIWARVHREYFHDNPAGIDVCEPGQTYMKDYAAYVYAKCRALGLAGRASEFAPADDRATAELATVPVAR